MKKTKCCFVALLSIFTLFIMMHSMAIAAPADVQFTSDYLVQKCIDIADNHPTVYGSGEEASLGTWNGSAYTFDCNGLVHSILWGWDGNKNVSCGGAVYNPGLFGEYHPDGWKEVIAGWSTDFSSIVPGEVLYMPGHFGVYIGEINGEKYVVESTPGNLDGNHPKGGVQKVKLNQTGETPKLPQGISNAFTHHAKFPPITYSPVNQLTIKSDPGGEITVGVSGKYSAGSKVSVSAIPYEDYEFTGWISFDGGSFENSSNASTVFTMPDNETEITATFRYTKATGCDHAYLYDTYIIDAKNVREVTYTGTELHEMYGEFYAYDYCLHCGERLSNNEWTDYVYGTHIRGNDGTCLCGYAFDYPIGVYVRGSFAQNFDPDETYDYVTLISNWTNDVCYAQGLAWYYDGKEMTSPKGVFGIDYAYDSATGKVQSKDYAIQPNETMVIRASFKVPSDWNPDDHRVRFALRTIYVKSGELVRSSGWKTEYPLSSSIDYWDIPVEFATVGSQHYTLTNVKSGKYLESLSGNASVGTDKYDGLGQVFTLYRHQTDSQAPLYKLFCENDPEQGLAGIAAKGTNAVECAAYNKGSDFVLIKAENPADRTGAYYALAVQIDGKYYALTESTDKIGNANKVILEKYDPDNKAQMWKLNTAKGLEILTDDPVVVNTTPVTVKYAINGASNSEGKNDLAMTLVTDYPKDLIDVEMGIGELKITAKKAGVAKVKVMTSTGISSDEFTVWSVPYGLSTPYIKLQTGMCHELSVIANDPNMQFEFSVEDPEIASLEAIPGKDAVNVMAAGKNGTTNVVVKFIHNDIDYQLKCLVEYEGGSDEPEEPDQPNEDGLLFITPEDNHYVLKNAKTGWYLNAFDIPSLGTYETYDGFGQIFSLIREYATTYNLFCENRAPSGLSGIAAKGKNDVECVEPAQCSDFVLIKAENAGDNTGDYAAIAIQIDGEYYALTETAQKMGYANKVVLEKYDPDNKAQMWKLNTAKGLEILADDPVIVNTTPVTVKYAINGVSNSEGKNDLAMTLAADYPKDLIDVEMGIGELKITAKKAGVAKVKVMTSTGISSDEFTVWSVPCKLSQTEMELAPGTCQILSVDTDDKDMNFSFTVQDTDVATIEPDGNQVVVAAQGEPGSSTKVIATYVHDKINYQMECDIVIGERNEESEEPPVEVTPAPEDEMEFVRVDNGHYTLMNLMSGKYLNTWDETTIVGTDQYDGRGQIFSLKKMGFVFGDSAYKLYCENSHGIGFSGIAAKGNDKVERVDSDKTGEFWLIKVNNPDDPSGVYAAVGTAIGNKYYVLTEAGMHNSVSKVVLQEYDAANKAQFWKLTKVKGIDVNADDPLIVDMSGKELRYTFNDLSISKDEEDIALDIKFDSNLIDVVRSAGKLKITAKKAGVATVEVKTASGISSDTFTVHSVPCKLSQTSMRLAENATAELEVTTSDESMEFTFAVEDEKVAKLEKVNDRKVNVKAVGPNGETTRVIVNYSNGELSHQMECQVSIGGASWKGWFDYWEKVFPDRVDVEDAAGKVTGIYHYWNHKANSTPVLYPNHGIEVNKIIRYCNVIAYPDCYKVDKYTKHKMDTITQTACSPKVTWLDGWSGKYADIMAHTFPESGEYHCNNSGQSFQCQGFIDRRAYQATGAYPTSWKIQKTYSRSELDQLFADVDVGDVIGWKSPHWLFVTSIDRENDVMGVLECNVELNCLIYRGYRDKINSNDEYGQPRANTLSDHPKQGVLPTFDTLLKDKDVGTVTRYRFDGELKDIPIAPDVGNGMLSITKGDKSEFTIGSNNDLEFNCNGLLSNFVRLFIDDEEVSTDAYSLSFAEKSQTKILLKGDFLNKLRTGEHKIKLVYNNDHACGTFFVLKRSIIDIIQGNNSYFFANSDGIITMTSSGEYDNFIRALVDGVELIADFFTVERGSTIITLKPEYLNTLESGEHTLTFEFTNGSSTGTFFIEDQEVILEHPEDQEVTEGQTATFAVKTAGENLSYQWYIDRQDGKGWVKIKGASEAEYTTQVTTLDNDGYQYYCAVTTEDGVTFDSDTASLRVLKAAALPDTGDHSLYAAYMALLGLSLLGIASLKRYRKA